MDIRQEAETAENDKSKLRLSRFPWRENGMHGHRSVLESAAAMLK
ncbi:hypothetical protein KL86PLE_30185 [uncultured Pleomorphomonas sp.]|uniref:Uncharacterized protein n=2 Tax=Pleomorphomonas TaxID=261933 RepID=A0A212LE18_9HYPH|nr:hypothetical protein KL86PLE_30185 [uncultured Pleomorphomonas sp.]